MKSVEDVLLLPCFYVGCFLVGTDWATGAARAQDAGPRTVCPTQPCGMCPFGVT